MAAKLSTATFTKKLKKELEKGLPKKIKAQISAQIHEKMNGRLAERLNKSAHAAQKTAAQAAEKTAQIATDTAHIAVETAKHGLDQVLIGLEHRGFNVKESQDLAQKVGIKVLERAEAIRAQIATSPFSPAWLKDVKIATPAQETSKAQAGGEVTQAASMTDATVSVAAEEVQPEQFEAREVTAASTVVDENDEDITAMQKPAKKTKRATSARASKSASTARAEK